ncbi:hypothetical protein PENSPDRAFT_653342, partial [Peniophora sp. CONT]
MQSPPVQPSPRYASSKAHPLLQPAMNRPLAIPIPGRAAIGTPFHTSPRFEYPFPSPPGAHSRHHTDRTRLVQALSCAHIHRHQHPLVRIRRPSAHFSHNLLHHPCRHHLRSASVQTPRRNHLRRPRVLD